MGARTAERAAALPAGRLQPAGRRALAQLRIALAALAAALVLLIVLLLAYELAAARVPQHRAALEELLRRQTGLEVRFSRLALRWGWYGPEAQFEDVELGELRGTSPLLRARTLVIALDAWRIVRSGHLEARQIILEHPLIDLLGDGHRTPPAAAQPMDLRRAGARLLGHWRGGRVTILAGTLRTLLPGSTEPVTLGLSHAQLQRLESHWSADAEVMLPQRLGASVHVSLQAQAHADLSSIESAEVSFEGRGLELAAWARLSAALSGVPRKGRGDLRVEASFLHDELVSASGRVSAQALEWEARASEGSPLAFDHLRGRWQLARRDRDWQLRVESLELERAARAHAPPTTLTLEVSPDGNDVHGEALHAPLASLLSLLRWLVPGLPREGLALGGEAPELSFDWRGQRAAGHRLSAYADLSGLEVGDEAGATRLSGLSGRAAAGEGSLELALHAHAGQLTLGPESPALEGLDIETHLTAAAAATGGWQLEARELHVRGEGFGLTASGSIGARGAHAPPAIDAHLLLSDADMGWVARLLAQRAPEPWRAAARAVRSGRLESAEVNWRGPLTETPRSAPGALFAGSLTVRDATLEESDLWPEASGLHARVNWHGAHFQASIREAHAAGFVLSDGRADWDLRAHRALRFTGRLGGDAGQLIAWLQSHPRAAAWAPGLSNLDLRGRTTLDLELALPDVTAGPARSASPRVRLAAFLDGAQLRAVPGLPPLEALQGAVAFADGHLQRSSLVARWLGGPATLTVGERREHGFTALLLSGRGTIDVRAAMQAAAVDADKAGLSGSADWSALLTVGGDGGAPRWQLHADSSLAGLTSHLPQPFDKSAATVLPLHIDWESRDDAAAAELRVAIAERLAASAALTRSAEGWRIERGAVRLSGAAPALPVEPVMLMDGNVSRLDLAAGLALWRLASSDPALPPLRARLTARELLCGASNVGEVNLAAEAAGGAGSVRMRSARFSGSASWPAQVDAAHPALLHFARFGLGETADPTAAAQIAAALAPAIDVSVEELRWGGHPLGSFSAILAVRGGTLEAKDFTVSGSHTLIRGSARCLASTCSLAFDLDSDDAAATLAAFGYDPELSARHGHIGARLRWWPQAPAPLATLGGSLHLQFEDGSVSPAAAPAADPFALLSVPALLSGMATGTRTPGQPALRFARLSGEYQLSDGVAVTSGVHMDGDAEILVRGSVGLATGDYDERAWVLRGEDRLPAPFRHFAPRPAVAALWLSLRDLLGVGGPAPARAALHLRGPWSDPIVTEVE